MGGGYQVTPPLVNGTFAYIVDSVPASCVALSARQVIHNEVGIGHKHRIFLHAGHDTDIVCYNAPKVHGKVGMCIVSITIGSHNMVTKLFESVWLAYWRSGNHDQVRNVSTLCCSLHFGDQLGV